MTQPSPSKNEPASRPPRGRGRWVIVLLLALIVIAVVAAWLTLKVVGYSMNGFQPPEMAAAQYSPRDVVGDLGGMPVTIPQHFANYVEYDGDPGFGETRKGPRPERNHQSKLMSFGYEVRIPDMAGMSSPEIRQDRKGYSIYDTPWIRVGVRTGEIYPGDGFLERSFDGLSNPDNPPTLRGERLPESMYGLTIHAPTGVDPKTNRPFREHDLAEDVFVHRGQDGKVDTFIRCANHQRGVARCRHDFSLRPAAAAQVSVSYRRSLLSEWQQIQSSVTQQLLSFKESDKTPVLSR